MNKKVLVVDDESALLESMLAANLYGKVKMIMNEELTMAQKLLLASKEPAVPAPPMTEKELYWANKGKKKDKRERIMNLLVCPPCADHKETRSRAHLGPFVNNGRGLIHENCPWQKGGVL